MELKIFLFVVSVAMTTVTSQIQNIRVPPGALVEFGQSGGAGGAGGQASGSMGQGMAQMAQGQMMSQMMGGAGQMMMGGAGQAMGGAGQTVGGSSQMMGGMGQTMGGTGQAMGGMGQTMGGTGQAMGGTGQAMGGAGQMAGGAGQMTGGAGQMMPPTPPGSPLQNLLSNMARMALALRQMYGLNQPLPPMEEPCPCDADCCVRPTDPRRVLPVLSIPMTLHRGCCGCVECPASLSPVISGMIQVAKMAASRQPPRDL
ncbi:uncharacterized protein LOC123528044 isoform X2 [Mercenaria mercenaria]|uniref:uncharacterized protein LOC123528044 isoform X2 n=1 Tax=Mercenaria mercenaria TaxID=6596 RepID=UPI00234ED8B9|nr:uncharacterized protein LOC123528044 isoform X2 [Mercenaria mercenaria]